MVKYDGLVEVTDEKKDDVLILRMTGRLDAISSPAAEKKVFEEINNGQIKIMLDFSGVDYLSSAGMRMLLSITKKLKSLTGKMVVCNVTENVMDVLKMSGFDHVIELSPNEDDALKKFK
ncbi:MAG: STAS domain-containing protein [Parachlamydiaceae bacterium]|nr:STAS domain-containing protein [Parachlamydiaceae bacterium]